MARTVSETEVSRPRRVTELGRHHSLGTIAGGFRGLAAAEPRTNEGAWPADFSEKGASTELAG